MRVFDNFERTDGRVAQTHESSYEFLNRASGDYWQSVRSVIQDWVDVHCRDELPDLLGRMKSNDPINFAGACWELFVHASLKRLGFAVSCHPELASTSKRPDFLAESQECTILVEATVVHESPDTQDSRTRKEQIYGEINKRVSSDDVFLRVSFDEQSKGDISFRRLGGDVQRYVDSLGVEQVREAYEAGGILGVDSYVWDDVDGSGWSIRLRPIPKRVPGPSEQIVGVMHGVGGFIDDASPIRTSLEGKSSDYGKNLDYPYVIAVASNRLFSGSRDFIDALYGKEVFRYHPESDKTSVSRTPNGLWRRRDGLHGEHVSAVLASSDFSVYKFTDATLDLFTHPMADKPLQCDLPIATVHRFDDGGRMVPVGASQSLADLHGLESPWPPGPPFA